MKYDRLEIGKFYVSTYFLLFSSVDGIATFVGLNEPFLLIEKEEDLEDKSRLIMTCLLKNRVLVVVAETFDEFDRI